MNTVNEADVIKMVALIKANYTYAYKDATRETMSMLVETWYTILKDYPAAVTAEAFKMALKACKYPPTIADLIEQINALGKATQLSDTELWDVLESATSRYIDLSCQFSYSFIPHGSTMTQGQMAREEAREVFNALPEKLKEYCGGFGGFVSIAGQEDLCYEKGRFLKAMPNIEQRIRIKNTMPKSLLEACEGVVLGISGKGEK
ncbi:MAG: hypothetical protein EOM59_11715 [Clostridia bacterium]|nr:hypothetical protein [Clostridia bacterium]